MRATTLAFKRARDLRRALTKPEAQLWLRLRRRIAGAPVFRRQHPMGPFILDFYCAAAKLAVEIDGWGHNMGDQPMKDARRTEWLRARGVDVVRLEATEVMRDPDETADRVRRTALARLDGEVDA